MNFRSEIEKLIQSNLQTYLDNSDRFIADYNRELELTKEYNGRQLLELLQNADDATSSEVLIDWNKNNLKLTISNKGEPFEAGGIKSLMLANLSTKTKISYIGNKGLGFRSILNWAEQINISSNGCTISFSEEIAKNVFNNQLDLSNDKKNLLRNDRNLSAETIPFPVLAIPKIKETDNLSDWATSIEITYRKEFETDIENQLSEIREEILLFLNNIQKITVQKGTELLELNSSKERIENYEQVTIQNKKWKVFSKENVLPSEHQDKSKNEQQSYNLKVAFQDDLSDNYNKLFNFFPTQLSISLPCIIHGTFELNSSRNHLNDSKKNEYILKELVQLMKDCALYLTEQGVDWRPYKLISPLSNASDSKLIVAFYKNLEELKKTESIYPSINNQYKKLDNAVYYNDEFNKFFKENFPEVLPELVIPLNTEIENPFSNDTYEHGSLVKEIDTLSKTKLSVELRAELITQLAKTISSNTKELFSLLINESDDIISKEDLAFTPVVRSGEEFKIPKSVKVDFMKSELYDLLISKFENGFDKKEPKSRELQRSIKSVVNLQPYDSNNVIDKIITGTKDILKTISTVEDEINSIKEMVLALYVNFKNIENRQEKLKITVPLISKGNKICNSDELYLNDSYPSGKLTEVIYSEILEDNDYLASINFWELNDNDEDSIESFFLWLGVNKHSKITTINLSNNWTENEYLDFLFANGTDQPDNFEFNKIQRDSIVSKIENFNSIKELPINKIILLVLKDISIRRLLEINDEKIYWFYVKQQPAIITSCSYIQFQFFKSNIFTKYILEEGGEDLNKLINENFQIDYEFLGRYGINKAEVKSILIKLGAKESFNEISPENVYEILKAIPEKDTDKKGKATQSIYKMALESLVKQESTFPIPGDIYYFSRTSDVGEYQSRDKVYYSDNSILPKKILNTLPLLNLPKRVGEDNVEKYFGVKSLKEFKIQIIEEKLKLNALCNVDLNTFFESIKPFILAYRLESPNLKKRISDNETKRKEAKTLKECKIHIVTQCLFKFGDNEENSIDEKEFINSKDTFYYKENIIQNVDGLKKDSLFCDAFAEMMCIVFKLNDLKNDFRQIFKNDIQDTIHLTNHDIGKEKLEEAYQLLGVSRVEIDFWKKIFELKNKQLIEPIETTEILKQKVLDNLEIIISDKYSNVDFENFGNKESYELIKSICDNLKLSVEQILSIGLSNWHKKGFEDCVKNNEYNFKQSVWSRLNSNANEQSKFISILNEYNLFSIKMENKTLENKYELDVDYNSIIKSEIKRQFDVDVSAQSSFEIKNKYVETLKKYDIEEIDISEESIRSLLYFEGNDTAIKNYLDEHFKTDEGEQSSSNGNSKIIGTLVDASLSKNGKSIQVSSGNGNGTWVHSSHCDKGKKQRGKSAEELVYNTLVDRYGVENVKWVSGNSTTPDKNDKLHYDIEYKNESSEWKFVEVKAMSDNQFIISNSEKDKGITESDKFEVALVKDNTIYVVKDIFKFKQGETFENNSKFVAFPKDYIFVFDLYSIINNKKM